MADKKLVYGICTPTWESFLKIIEHLDWVSRLDVDIIHLSPFFPSNDDDEYSVTNYMDVDPKYGTINDFIELVKYAHSKNLKVYIELPISHTSTKHPWFKKHPNYYLRRMHASNQWTNMVHDDPAWVYDEETNEYYLQLYGDGTANLRWHVAGYLYQPMVDNYRQITSFWYFLGIDGFYISTPQAINYCVNSPTNNISEFYFGHRAVEVIQAIFDWSEYPEYFKKPGLIIEIEDPTHGGLIDYYANETGAMVIDLSLKDSLKKDLDSFSELSGYGGANLLLNLEDCNSPRFQVQGINCDPKWLNWELFNSNAKNIYLLQGQELGLRNPCSRVLPMETVLATDWKAKTVYEHQCVTANKYQEKEHLMKTIRENSHANVRLPIPTYLFEQQARKFDSTFFITRSTIEKWRKNY